MRFASTFRFLGRAFAVNVKAVLEYRANFFLQVFGMMLNNAAFAVFWKVLIDRTGGVGGYGFTDIMFVWAVSSTSFGLAHVVAGNIRSISRMVREGELDVYLLQPRDVWLNVVCSRTVVSAWGDFAYGFIVLALMPGVGLGRWLVFLAIIPAAALVFAAAFSAAETLAFWLGDSQGISGALQEFLLSFSLYPETIFEPGMRWIFYTLVPSAFVAYVPLAAWRSLDWGAVGVVWAAALAWLLLTRALFRAGLKRYESGNKMGARI